jgi:hypothetical protein
MEERNQTLMNLSQLAIQNILQWKLDKIADVHIHGLPYFTVFRRYNSPYEIIVEYTNGDTYLQRDMTIRRSLQAVLCLSNKEIAQLYTHTAHSYRHNEPLTDELADQCWLTIQEQYDAIAIDVGGILLDFQATCEQINSIVEPPRTPVKKPTSEKKQAPHAPCRSRNPLVEEENPVIVDRYPIDLTIQEEPWVLVLAQEKEEDHIVLRSGVWIPKRSD